MSLSPWAGALPSTNCPLATCARTPVFALCASIASASAWALANPPDGGLMVVDYQAGRILEFDAAGKIVHQMKNLSWAMTSVGVMP